MHLLDKKFSNPLEREYEAWIIQGIEDYFSSIGEKVAIWSVSPKEEVNWPADEHMVVGKKLIGLQFKRVTPDKNSPKDFKRLKWTFHNPPGQFDLVSRFPEIYYCLPTFISRDYRRQAIHHCLFWRPDPNEPRDRNAWYDNENASTPYKSIFNAPRWGLFLEEIIGCKIGKKVTSITDAKNYINSVKKFMQTPELIMDPENNYDNKKNTQPNETFVYFIALPYQS